MAFGQGIMGAMTPEQSFGGIMQGLARGYLAATPQGQQVLVAQAQQQQAQQQAELDRLRVNQTEQQNALKMQELEAEATERRRAAAEIEDRRQRIFGAPGGAVPPPASPDLTVDGLMITGDESGAPGGLPGIAQQYLNTPYGPHSADSAIREGWKAYTKSGDVMDFVRPIGMANTWRTAGYTLAPGAQRRLPGGEVEARAGYAPSYHPDAAYGGGTVFDRETGAARYIQPRQSLPASGQMDPYAAMVEAPRQTPRPAAPGDLYGQPGATAEDLAARGPGVVANVKRGISNVLGQAIPGQLFEREQDANAYLTRLQNAARRLFTNTQRKGVWDNQMAMKVIEPLSADRMLVDPDQAVKAVGGLRQIVQEEIQGVGRKLARKTSRATRERLLSERDQYQNIARLLGPAPGQEAQEPVAATPVVEIDGVQHQKVNGQWRTVQ